MRTSFVAGISLVLVLGCGTEETANSPGTSTPAATGGDTSSSAKQTTTATTKPSGSTAKGGSTGKGGASSGQNAKGGTSEGKATDGGASDGGASDSDPATGGTGGKGSANPSTGGKVNTTGGKSTASVGGKSGVGGNKASGGAGGAATGGKSSGNPSTGGTSGSKTSGGNTGGTVSSTTTTGSGNTTAASFKCDNLAAAAGSAGKAKPSGAAGDIKVLDWAGFKGAVSFTFDDGNPSQTSSYAQLKATGARSTFFLISSNVSNATWKTAVADGNEIGNHTSNHAQGQCGLNYVTSAQSTYQSTFGVTVYSMAAPYGDACWGDLAKQAGLLLNRGVSNGLVKPKDSTNQYSLPAYIPPENASSSAMDNEVNAAVSGNGWKIFCIHGFDKQNGTYQPVPIGNVTATMSNAVKNGAWADTMGHVGAYWLGQKAINASGNKATWTVPANMPKNMCVRITTSGGTVKQKGAEVPWDDHGYYQISLDAGEVTVE